MTAPTPSARAADLLHAAAERVAAGDSILAALSAAGIQLHPADVTSRKAALTAAVALLATAQEIPDYGQPGQVGHVFGYDDSHTRPEVAAVLTACAERIQASRPTAEATA